MFENSRSVQVRVGFFVLIGFAIFGGMAIYFGRLGEGIRGYYRINVEFANASGLIKGGDVLMAGAKIGTVAEAPIILPTMRGVTVPLQVYEEVKIPTASRFLVGSSGLLGDRYVDVILDEQAKELVSIAPNATVQGSRSTGMDDLAAQGSILISDLRTAIQNVNTVVVRINTEVLSEAAVKGLSETVSNLKATSDNFQKASQGLDATIGEVRGAVKGVDAAVKTGDAALVSAKGAADDARKAIEDIRGFVRQMRYGKGIVPELISNAAIAADFRALVSNLRERGILFYRDAEKPRKKEN